MAVRGNQETVQIALTRFGELMSDMGWDENTAIKELYEEIGRPLGMTVKGIERWFERGIPAEHIFNISTILGVDAGWLAGQSHIEKSDAIRPVGLYSREMARVNRRRPVSSGKKRT